MIIHLPKSQKHWEYKILKYPIQAPDPGVKEICLALVYRLGHGMQLWLPTFLFMGLVGSIFISGFQSVPVIKQRLLRASLTGWVPRQHDLLP